MTENGRGRERVGPREEREVIQRRADLIVLTGSFMEIVHCLWILKVTEKERGANGTSISISIRRDATRSQADPTALTEITHLLLVLIVIKRGGRRKDAIWNLVDTTGLIPSAMGIDLHLILKLIGKERGERRASKKRGRSAVLIAQILIAMATITGGSDAESFIAID